MSVIKNSSVSNRNSGFIPDSEVNSNFEFLNNIATKSIPQNLKVAEVRASKRNSKSKVTIGLNFDNGSIQTQYLSGSIDDLIAQINNYKLPETDKNYPVDISISYNEKELQKLQSSHTPEPKSVGILFFYFLKSVKDQLVNRPKQFVSTELAANILNIQHESMLELLQDGEIPFSKIKNSKCVCSKNLFKYREMKRKKRSDLLTQLMQEIL